LVGEPILASYGDKPLQRGLRELVNALLAIGQKPR